MSGPRVRAVVLALAFSAIAAFLEAEKPNETARPNELHPVSEVLLPGRLPWGATALSTGEFLAPCEDHTLRVFDQNLDEIAHWTAPIRFAGPVRIAPRGPVQLMAIPLSDGRIQVLSWEPLTHNLGVLWASTGPEGRVAFAWSGQGHLMVGRADGTLENWTPQGILTAKVRLGFPVHQVLVDDGLGVYVWGPSQVQLIGPESKILGKWDFEGTPLGVMQTTGGIPLAWTETGLWKLTEGATSLTKLLEDKTILGVCADRQDQLIVVCRNSLVLVNPLSGRFQRRSMPREFVTGPVIDDRGRFSVGTIGGLELWTYDGRYLETFDRHVPISSPLATNQGGLLWSSSDWRLRLWTNWKVPPWGWAQDGGDQRRAFSARRPSLLNQRTPWWKDDPDFSYFFLLASSAQDSSQRQVLDRLEAAAVQDPRLEKLPWANLVLLKVAQSGITDLEIRDNRITNSWPQNRLRAFELLAQTVGPEERDDLLTLLSREYDPSVVAQAFRALARSGWDGDGKILRAVAIAMDRFKSQAVVADAAVEAAREIWSQNGASTDPVLVPLVTSIFQGPYPKATRLKAQLLFQDLVMAP